MTTSKAGSEFIGPEFQEKLTKLEQLAKIRRQNTIKLFQPYDKQVEFFDGGSEARERMLAAGNQQGKTWAGAHEAAYHATGMYPDWWLGRRWDRPTRGWCAGVSAAKVRDVPQSLLFGQHSVEAEFGSGIIPAHMLDRDKIVMGRGAPGGFDIAYIKHVSGGWSWIMFKSYEQGRTKFQSDTIDWFWGDEEPPADIYSEMLTRTNATGGMGFLTLTPLLGMSEVAGRFFDNEHPHPDQRLTLMTIEDAKHISQKERERIIASYPAHEREARIYGRPMLGEGRIFPFAQEALSEPVMAFEDVPSHWWKLWGIDFGIGHPFGAVLIAWDKDTDVIHVLHAFKVADQLPIQHVQAMMTIAGTTMVSWPHDGANREKGTGEELQMLYKKLGLRMRGQRAEFETGGISTEAGIQEMNDRFASGRLRIAHTLRPLFEEIGLYHRKDGLIVKLRDDLISALRTAIMDKRFAQQGPIGPVDRLRPRHGQTIAHGVDFDLFGGGNHGF
jgi:phage terminase large subunit-like protein